MLGFLGDLLGLNAGQSTSAAAVNNRDVAARFNETGNQIIGAGKDEAGGYLGQVAGLYDGQINRGQQGTALYDDAMGLNGADGNARATGAFRTNPGYEFQRDQGLQALDRRRSAGGSFQSGGADTDTLSFATGLADQSFGDWLSRLGGYENTVNNGIAGKAGGLNNLANLATGAASQTLDLGSQTASALMAGNNQNAQGEEAGRAGMASLGSNLMGMAGRAFGWGGF